MTLTSEDNNLSSQCKELRRRDAATMVGATMVSLTVVVALLMGLTGSVSAAPVEVATASEAALTSVPLDVVKATNASYCLSAQVECIAGPDELMLDRLDAGPVLQVREETMMYSSDFGSGTARDFQNLSGGWEVANGFFNQTMDCGYDYTALLLTQAMSTYKVEASFHSIAGVNHGGLVIHQSTPDTRAGATLVDLTDNGNTIRWGTYDDQGTYVFQGARAIPPVAEQQSVTITLDVDGNKTTVSFNQQTITTMTNDYSSGMVGLVTSKSMVAFENVQITAMPSTSVSETPAPAPARAEADPASKTAITSTDTVVGIALTLER